MAFKLNQIVPWGRSFDEYVRMFGLTDSDLEKKMDAADLACARYNRPLDQLLHPQLSQLW